MTVNPRKLALFLEDLAHGLLQRLQSVSSLRDETANSVRWAERVADDLTGRMASLDHELRESVQACVDAHGRARQLNEAALDADEEIRTLASEADRARQRAEITRNDWRRKLQEAESELAAARREEMRARMERESAHGAETAASARRDEADRKLRSAEVNLSTARNELFAAESALNSCRSRVVHDSQGRRQSPNCGAYEMRVSSARGNVATAEQSVNRARVDLSRAEQDLAAARQRLQAARAWVDRATARVHRAQARHALCQDRFAKAGELVDAVNETQTRAAKAAGLSETSRFLGGESLRLADQATGNGDEATQLAQAASQEVRSFLVQVEEARRAAADASSLTNRLMENTAQARRELEASAELLEQYDMPHGLK